MEDVLTAILQEAFEFKKPVRPASRGCLHSHGLEESKDLFTQRQNSAPARMVCALAFMGEFLVGTELKHSLSPGVKDTLVALVVFSLTFEIRLSHVLVVLMCLESRQKQSERCNMELEQGIFNFVNPGEIICRHPESFF